MKTMKEIYERKLICVFFLFLVGAGIGWSYEVILHIVQSGDFVNRGMLHGPWLPIYGIGCVLVAVLKKWAGKKPVVFFGACFLASGVLEYTTSWAMEVIYHKRWWDYSKLPLNVNGRVFLGGLIVFALVGCLFAYVLLPAMEKKYHKIPQSMAVHVAHFLAVTFVLDLLISVFVPNIGAGIAG